MASNPSPRFPVFEPEEFYRRFPHLTKTNHTPATGDGAVAGREGRDGQDLQRAAWAQPQGVWVQVEVRMSANFAQDIEEAADLENIEGVVIGEMGWGDYQSELVPRYAEIPRGKLLSWSEARPFLDFLYETGYGAPGCPAVYVWTQSRVLFVVQYDGSTRINSVPRNPVAVVPEMPGG